MDQINGKLGAQEVATATGTTPKQITDWCNQGHIVGQKRSLGKGHKREFTFSNVMEIAGGVALMQHGIRSPSDAFRAAVSFAHIAKGPIGFVAEDGTIQDEGFKKRWPGLPHHHLDGETFLFVSGDHSVVLLVEKGSINTRTIFPFLHPAPSVFIALNMTDVFKQVTRNIGHDYRVVLDQVYGR